MSAPPAGKNQAPPVSKFNDHYAILGIDASADTETIQRAYARLLDKYGPNNIDTRDDDKLKVINTAYQTLSDPEKRFEFDALKGVSGDHGRPMFTGVDFFDVLGRELGLRMALLCVFYDRRRNRPFTPALSMRHIESIIDSSLDALTFALWYLKQRGYVLNDDKSNLQITVDGMDFLEANRPSAGDVMPHIKKAAIAPPRPGRKAEPAASTTESLPELMAATSPLG